MKKLADISLFERLSDKSCCTNKGNVAVFNDLSKLEEMANSCNFKLVKDFDAGNEVSYSLVPCGLGYTFDELRDAIDVCKEASDSNPHWLKIHQNRLVEGNGWEKYNLNFLPYIPYSLNEEGKFQVLYGEQRPTGGYFRFTDSQGQHVGSDSWGEGYDLHEVIENLDFDTDGMGYALKCLLFDLDRFCRQANTAIQLAKEYKEFLEGKKDKAQRSLKRALKKSNQTNITVSSPFDSSDYMDVPNPGFDDSFID